MAVTLTTHGHHLTLSRLGTSTGPLDRLQPCYGSTLLQSVMSVLQPSFLRRSKEALR